VVRLCSPQVEKEMLKFLIFQDRFDILPVAELLEMRFSGVAEQEYTELYWKSQVNRGT
jgi:hypothetical protein